MLISFRALNQLVFLAAFYVHILVHTDMRWQHCECDFSLESV